jgi:hypothetical protein
MNVQFHPTAVKSDLEARSSMRTDPLLRLTADLAAKLNVWLGQLDLPATASPRHRAALQQLGAHAQQLERRMRRAVEDATTPWDEPEFGLPAIRTASVDIVLLTLDSAIGALRTLLAAVKADHRAFSLVDDLVGLRDETAARFPPASRVSVERSPA